MMSRAANLNAIDADLIAIVMAAPRWTQSDTTVLDQLSAHACPTLLVINKIDRLADKSALLPLIDQVRTHAAFSAIVPVSASTGDNLAHLEAVMAEHMPHGAPGFPADQVSDRNQRFLAGELIREQLCRQLGQELPYATAVEVENMEQSGGEYDITGSIWVDKKSQKPIVIGAQGSRLKSIGSRAREEMQRVFDAQVHLSLWVKVKGGWAEDVRQLRALGYAAE